MSLMDSEAKLYELSYLISPAMDEAEAKNFHQSIKNIVQETGGLIDEEGEIRKQHLSYPIKKMREAFFAHARFLALPEKLEQIKNALSEKREGILRYLLIQTKRTQITQPFVKKNVAITPEGTVVPPVQVETLTRIPETPAISIEEIDKRLEEILGN